MKGLACPVPGEASLPGLRTATVTDMMSPLIRRLTLTDQGPFLMASSSLNYILKTPPPNTIPLGVGTSVYESGEHSVRSRAWSSSASSGRMLSLLEKGGNESQ